MEPEKQIALLEGLKVLVIDADEDTRLLYAEVLTYYGAAVAVASSILEAQLTLAQFDPDAVVADLVLEGQYVYDFLPRLHSIPVIVTTAIAFADAQEHALRRGISFYLLRPVELDALANAVYRSVQTKAMLWAC
uniref:Response regulator receiver protein n=1 Tax=Cyanothece sp. (strain PCC 7425 / ATCC 29141) TaxID=395961 RepID=B8HM30_CYAP4